MAKNIYYKPSKQLEEKEKETAILFFITMLLLILTAITKRPYLTLLFITLTILYFEYNKYLRIRIHQNNQYEEIKFRINEINEKINKR